MTILTRQAIAEKTKHKIEEFEVPEWGGSVFVRGLTSKEFSIIMKGKTDKTIESQSIDEHYKMFMRIALWVILDENGDRLFTDKDASILEDTSFETVSAIGGKSFTLSGNTEQAEKN